MASVLRAAAAAGGLHQCPSAAQPRRAAARGSAKSAKVAVRLCDYTAGAIRVAAERAAALDEEALEAEVQEELDRTHELVRVNFTGSGASLGHTVQLEMKACYADGELKNQPVPGLTADISLDLQEGNPFPLNIFTEQIVEQGMGQMESKTFGVTFPSDWKSERLQNVGVLFTVMIKEIAQKRALPPRSEEERDTIRAEIEGRHAELAARETAKQLDLAIRESLLQNCAVDTQKTVESVSWAKFGEASTKDYAYNMILEEIGAREGLSSVDEVKKLLRDEAEVTWL